MGNEIKYLTKNKIYDELGINYRHFLQWRHAVVLAVGGIDFAAYKVIWNSHHDIGGIIVLTLFFLVGLSLLMLFELRSTEIYRRAITTAKKIEGRRSGYYSMMDKDNKQEEENVNDKKESNKNNWHNLCKGFVDLMKPTHTGFILWFIIISMISILIISAFKYGRVTAKNTTPYIIKEIGKLFDTSNSTRDSIIKTYDKRFDSLYSKIDSIHIQLQNLCINTKSATISPSDSSQPHKTTVKKSRPLQKKRKK